MRESTGTSRWTGIVRAALGLGLAAAGAVGAAAENLPAPVTFSGQIAPLMYANCTACHRDGETAPFSLVTYADAKKHAKQIADVTSRGVMPPWKAQAGHGDFLGVRRLDAAQIALIQQWVNSDCPPGDPAATPPPPQFTSGWQLGEPDLIVKMAEPYELAAEGRDAYRCFVIPLQIPPGKYLQAVEYRPSNRRIVHHALLTSLKHDAAAFRLIMTGDGKSFSSGLVAPGERLPGSLGLWTPGLEPRPLPDGYANAWPAGCDLVLQLHLHPSGKPEREQSSVGLHFTSEKPHGRLKSLVMLYKDIDIAPGDGRYAVDTSMLVKSDAAVYGIFPHMHLLGRTVQVTALLPDGTTRPMISIGDWDFNWQNYYQYAAPFRLPAGTRLKAHWTFDNSASNPANPSQPPRRVRFGEQTTNEMAALILDVIPTGPVKLKK
jgi:mono/diheme cytochrome c family protein